MTNEIKTACGSDIVDEKKFIVYQNKIIYFCEEDCKIEFIDNPVKFLSSDHFLINLDLIPTIGQNDELLPIDN